MSEQYKNKLAITYKWVIASQRNWILSKMGPIGKTNGRRKKLKIFFLKRGDVTKKLVIRGIHLLSSMNGIDMCVRVSLFTVVIKHEWN